MKKIIRFCRNNALLLAMLMGALLYKWLSPLAFLSPYLIFVMLFFTFCKVNPTKLRLYRWHGILLAFQIVVSIILFFAIRSFDLILAQGIMLCVFMPTATAAAVITGKLGGNITELTTYTLLTNLLMAILAPIIFPLINPVEVLSWHTFLAGFLTILRKVTPVLVVPFLLALCIRITYKKAKKKELVLNNWLSAMPFYVWVFALMILIARTVDSLIHDEYAVYTAWGLAAGAVLTCALQFYVGKKIGKNDSITTGQALGQKNTMLAIWMAQTYLIPITSVAPALYAVFQNLFNAWQLRQRMRKINNK